MPTPPQIPIPIPFLNLSSYRIGSREKKIASAHRMMTPLLSKLVGFSIRRCASSISMGRNATPSLLQISKQSFDSPPLKPVGRSRATRDLSNKNSPREGDHQPCTHTQCLFFLPWGKWKGVFLDRYVRANILSTGKKHEQRER